MEFVWLYLREDTHEKVCVFSSRTSKGWIKTFFYNCLFIFHVFHEFLEKFVLWLGVPPPPLSGSTTYLCVSSLSSFINTFMNFPDSPPNKEENQFIWLAIWIIYIFQLNFNFCREFGRVWMGLTLVVGNSLAVYLPLSLILYLLTLL